MFSWDLSRRWGSWRTWSWRFSARALLSTVMTVNGWLQILLFFVAVAAFTPLAGRYMTVVFTGGARGSTGCSGRSSGALPGVPYRPGRRDAVDRVRRRHAGVQCRVDAGAVRPPAPAGLAAAQPAGVRRGLHSLVLQHGRLVHVEYQLAGVLGRVDDELPHPDGRARVSQLRFGGGRHRAGDRVHPRHRPPRAGHDRQFLGRHHPRSPVDSAARSASWPRSSSSRRVWSRT